MIHKNLESLLIHFSNELRGAVKSRLKTTTESFIKSYVDKNFIGINENENLLEDLEKIKLKNKDLLVYTHKDMERDKIIIKNIINNVKHNNYSFWTFEKKRNFK